jgi:hypothetical protein
MDNDYVVIVDGDLYHHGIIGMKWGRRRYQNKDGSLTAAGKKRYEAEAAKLKEREKMVKNREKVAAQQAKLDAKKANLDARERVLDADKIAAKEAKEQAKAARKEARAIAKAERQAKKASEAFKTKSLKDMTDDEIITAIARKQLEDRYNQMYPTEVSKGKRFMQRVINDVVVPSAIDVGKNALGKLGDNLIKKYIPDAPVDPNSVEGLKINAEKSKYRKEIAENNQKAREANEGKKKSDVPNADNWDAMNKRAEYAAKYGPNGELDPSRNPNAFTRRSTDGANTGSTAGKSDAGSTKPTETTKPTKTTNTATNNTSKSVETTISNGKKAVNSVVQNSKQSNLDWAQRTWGKDYYEKVDQMLATSDALGWDKYYMESLERRLGR